ncbi:MAG: hypothetical protein KJ052_04290 [Candidatus Hydrogenedentes bacterium]|nr:hypothetical protein [Candidatus Hydrogenedentota bacterium]
MHDLYEFCPAIQERVRNGLLVYDLNFTLFAGTAEWNVDLVLGAPALGAEADEAAIPCAPPSTVQIAIEIKSVMTEHRKAVKNRKRDLEAHHEHVHNYNDSAIAGGVLVINAASTFRSPLRPEATAHKNVDRLVQHCIDEFRAVSVRGGKAGYGLDSKCAIVLKMDNINPSATSFLGKPPAPQIGDPIHYDSFIRTICDLYSRRFPA